MQEAEEKAPKFMPSGSVERTLFVGVVKVRILGTGTPD